MASPWPKSSLKDNKVIFFFLQTVYPDQVKIWLDSCLHKYISLFRTERRKPPLGNPNPIRRHIPIFHQNTFAASFGRVVTIDWVSPRPWVELTTHRNCHVDKIHIRISLILEIKNAIWEIKRDKFWKSKMAFEKSKETSFGNQKYHLINQTRQILEIKSVIWEVKRSHFENQTCTERIKLGNFGNQKCSWEIKRVKFWKSNISWKIKMKH